MYRTKDYETNRFLAFSFLDTKSRQRRQTPTSTARLRSAASPTTSRIKEFMLAISSASAASLYATEIGTRPITTTDRISIKQMTDIFLHFWYQKYIRCSANIDVEDRLLRIGDWWSLLLVSRLNGGQMLELGFNLFSGLQLPWIGTIKTPRVGRVSLKSRLSSKYKLPCSNPLDILLDISSKVL